MKIKGFKKLKFNFGFSLIELVVALALFFILASGVMFVVISSYSNFSGAGDRQTVADFAQEGLEAVKSIAQNNWMDIENVAGTNLGVALNSSTKKWEFSGTSNSRDGLTRIINIINVSRSDGNIVESGGSADRLTKRVTIRVTGSGISEYVLSSYLTNWDYITWEQTDWSYGNGYTFWGKNTAYDSSTTITATSTAGEIKLTSFKGAYDASGTLYTSRVNMINTDKKIYKLIVNQDVPTGCTNTIYLEVDATSDFPSPSSKTFSSTASYYESDVSIATVGEEWFRFKIDMTNCQSNAATPTLYSLKLIYY